MVDEELSDPSEKGNGPVLWEAEEAVREAYSDAATIVRFGGLIGPDRHPVRYLSGRQSSRSGDAAVNMIHQADAVGILQCIIEKGLWGDRFNACAPEHPTREAFYVRAAEVLGIPSLSFDPKASLSYKIVDPSHLIERSGYRFRYPDPLEMPVE